jgi:hypothetical protein
MQTQHVSVFGVASTALILAATGAATRLAEVALGPAVRLTTAAGGGYLTPDDIVAADTRQIAVGLLRLLLPGILIQALLIKLVVGSRRGLQLSYFATASVLGTCAVGSLGLASVVGRVFADNRALHELTPLSPAAVYLAVAFSAVTIVLEAFVLQGLIEQPIGRYPLLLRRAS